MFNEVKEGFIQSVVTSFLPYVSSEREIHEVMLEAKTVREENTDFIDHYTLSSWLLLMLCISCHKYYSFRGLNLVVLWLRLWQDKDFVGRNARATVRIRHTLFLTIWYNRRKLLSSLRDRTRKRNWGKITRCKAWEEKKNNSHSLCSSSSIACLIWQSNQSFPWSLKKYYYWGSYRAIGLISIDLCSHCLFMLRILVSCSFHCVSRVLFTVPVGRERVVLLFSSSHFLKQDRFGERKRCCFLLVSFPTGNGLILVPFSSRDQITELNRETEKT